MNVHQTKLGFWRADASGAPQRRTRVEAQADADMIDPPAAHASDRTDRLTMAACFLAAVGFAFLMVFVGEVRT